MDITISAVATEEIPGTNRKPHNAKYHLVFDPAIAHPEKWVSVPTSFVAGPTNTRKQVTLHNAASVRGIKIKTRIRGEVIYLRYVGPAQPKITVPEQTVFRSDY